MSESPEGTREWQECGQGPQSRRHLEGDESEQREKEARTRVKETET